MGNIIKLEISKEYTHIAGHELGSKLCKEQILPKLIGGVINIIEIPEHVEAVAIGFMQGMKGELLKFDSNISVKFKARDKELEERIIKSYNY